MKVYKQLAGQTLVYGLGTIVPRLLNYLLLTPFYTRIFLKAEYGSITEIYSYVAFLMVLLTYGMETTYFRFASEKGHEKSVFNSAFTSLLFTTLVFITIVYFNVESIASLIGYEHSKNFIIWFSLIVSFDALTAIPFAKLRQENKAIKFALIKIGNISINIGFNIFFLVVCKNSDNEFFSSLYKPEINVGYAFISNLIASAFNMLVLFPVFKGYRICINMHLYKQLFKYSMPLMVVGLAGMVNEVADKLFLKYLTPEHLIPLEQVGIYGANYKLAVLMTIFIQMFKYAAEPFFFKQAGETNAKHIYAQVMNYFVLFCLLIFLPVTLYIDVFKFFIGKPYHVGLHIVPIVLLANMFLGIYYNLSVWYKINNLTKYGAIISLIGVIITIVINLIFIPIYGFTASAWATFLCYFIMMVLSYLLGSKFYKVPYNLKRVFFYILLAIGIYFVRSFINYNTIINFGVSTLLFIVFLAIVLKIEKIKYTDFKRIVKR